MLYRTVLPLGGANFVLDNKRILANKCIKLCYCFYKRIRLLTRIYGMVLVVCTKSFGDILVCHIFSWSVIGANISQGGGRAADASSAPSHKLLHITVHCN